MKKIDGAASLHLTYSYGTQRAMQLVTAYEVNGRKFEDEDTPSRHRSRTTNDCLIHLVGLVKSVSHKRDDLISGRMFSTKSVRELRKTGGSFANVLSKYLTRQYRERLMQNKRDGTQEAGCWPVK